MKYFFKWPACGLYVWAPGNIILGILNLKAYHAGPSVFFLSMGIGYAVAGWFLLKEKDEEKLPDKNSSFKVESHMPPDFKLIVQIFNPDMTINTWACCNNLLRSGQRCPSCGLLINSTVVQEEK